MKKGNLLFEGGVWLSCTPGPVPMLSSSDSTDGEILTVSKVNSPKNY